MAQRPRSWGAGFAASRNRTALPPELKDPIATTGDGRDITRPWVGELEEARDPRLLQAADWGAYDRILLDDQVKSCLEQRRRAVVSRDWDVIPGDDKDPRSVEASARFKTNIESVGWDLVTDKMLYAPFHGYAVAELMWAPVDGLWQFAPTDRCRAIHVRHARRFRYDKDGHLRLLTTTQRNGIILPDRKFWVVTSGGSDDDTPYGRGLAEWLYWPTLFKRNGVRFWNIFLDKFSVPTAKGTYPRGTSPADQAKLLQAVQAIATDSGFVIPEGMAVELLTLAGTGADFAAVCRYMDSAIAKIILSQTMTTDNGSSRAQGEVHADVKLEVVKADADLLSDSFNAGPARWWTDLNYGTDVASPQLVRIVEEEDDLKEAADTDQVLLGTGWRRTEESFKDRYGDGFERTPAPGKPPQGADKPDDQADDAAAGDDDAEGGADNVVPIRATAFAEMLDQALSARDVVDDAVDAAMADDGWRTTLGAITDPLVQQLQAATSAEDVAAIIAREAELGDDGPLAEALARAGFATRIDALTDASGEG